MNLTLLPLSTIRAESRLRNESVQRIAHLKDCTMGCRSIQSAAEIWKDYEWGLRTWISNGWLMLYPEEKLGTPKGLIPLTAVLQQNKSKVRLVMEFQEFNHHVDAFTANTDVCAAKVFQCVFGRSQKSILPGTCPWVTVTITDREIWREKILPDTFGIRSECSSPHHEGFGQYSAGSGRNRGARSSCLHRWHLYQ